MPKPFKPTRPYPLPEGAEIVQHEGRPHVRMKERGRAVLYRVSKDGTKFLRPAKRWYIDVRDANGTVRRVKGFADLKATEQLAAELERKASRVRSGHTDPAEEHARRPLADHLKDYAAHLEAKGGTSKHVRLTIGRISALFAGCGFAFPKDMDAGNVSAWLNALRRDGAPIELPDGDSFTPGDVAKLLGVGPSALARTLSRHQLAATGNGKARRLPRSTVEILVTNKAKGAGPTTANHYIRAVRGFTRWLVKAKRIGSDPLDTLHLLNEAVDVRRARRELTAEELRALLAGTRTSARTFRGLSGEDRFTLYLVAAGTGFRANALANLTPGDFDLDSQTVTLAARFNKSRKLKVQPLPADVAEVLRPYLTGKPAGSPVWGGTWSSSSDGAEMLRRDLETIGIPYAVEGPDGPEYADFHALRHTFLTMLGRNGVDLRTAQELAGHSKPELTARYSHRRLYDLAGAVEKLPNLVPSKPDATAGQLPLRLTGTDGAGAVPGAVPGAVTGGIRLHQTALKGTAGAFGPDARELLEPLENKRPGAVLHRAASNCTSEPGGTRTLDQRINLPLGYDSNTNRQQHLTPNAAAGCSAGCSEQQSEGGNTDPELAALVAAWPTLPEPIRAGISAMNPGRGTLTSIPK